MKCKVGVCVCVCVCREIEGEKESRHRIQHAIEQVLKACAALDQLARLGHELFGQALQQEQILDVLGE